MDRAMFRTVAMVATLLLLIALDVGAVAASSSLGGKIRYGDTVIVPAGETVASDLYVFAGTVTMDGTVQGDLVAAGGHIQVGGTVGGDIIVAGGTVDITGSVGGAIRAAGGPITVSGDVKGDVLVGSGSLVLASSGHVGGDLIFGAGEATVAGTVAGSIQGQAGSYSRTGPVGGTENVTNTHPGAVPPGGLPPVVAPPGTPGGLIADALRQFVVVVLFGALALWLKPRGLRAAAGAVRHRPLIAFGGGVLAVLGYVVLLLALLVVMVLLAIAFGLLTLGSLVGLTVAAWVLATLGLTFVFVVVAAFLADAIVGLALGHLVVPAPEATASRWRDVAILTAGAAVVVIVTSLPIVGPWVKLVVVLLGLGSLATVAWTGWRTGRAAGAIPTPAQPVPPIPPVATA
ncbi:MAG: polymer-forming cytoskeletal protein [Candidatus Limnocylindrales bacterium]